MCRCPVRSPSQATRLSKAAVVRESPHPTPPCLGRVRTALYQLPARTQSGRAPNPRRPAGPSSRTPLRTGPGWARHMGRPGPPRPPWRRGALLELPRALLAGLLAAALGPPHTLSGRSTDPRGGPASPASSVLGAQQACEQTAHGGCHGSMDDVEPTAPTALGEGPASPLGPSSQPLSSVHRDSQSHPVWAAT